MQPFTIGLTMAIIGVILLIIEISEPGFFIAIPGTILIFIGIITMAFPGIFWTVWTPIIAIVISIPATGGTLLMYKKIAPPAKSPITLSRDSLINKKGIVIKKIVPNTMDGKVKIENQTWSAVSEGEIEKGEKIIVKDAKGVHVIVEKEEKC
jgi:Membrane-bound serine protease (ClpP class)